MPGSHSSTPGPSAEPAAGGGGLVLLVLSSGQFLMTLDASVMNVSIQSVAHDVGTTVSGIQTAITMYTLVMAAFMITGGKIGAIIGRRKAMAIGLVVYGLGSAITAVAPNLGVLLLGWSLLEGLGAALILPAIVALVAGNFPQKRRSSAYGAIAAAGAVAIAVGPIIGGAVTTFASWRWVFVGEVVLVLVILVLLNRIHDAPPSARKPFDVVGASLSIVGLSAFVFGVLESGDWGWVKAKPGGPKILGTSPVTWLDPRRPAVIYAFFAWEGHRQAQGREPFGQPPDVQEPSARRWTGPVLLPVPRPSRCLLHNPALLVGRPRAERPADRARLLPLSIALLATALGVPRLAPKARPRLVVRLGLGIHDRGHGGDDRRHRARRDAGIVTIPMLLMGLGIGALASPARRHHRLGRPRRPRAPRWGASRTR